MIHSGSFFYGHMFNTCLPHVLAYINPSVFDMKCRCLGHVVNIANTDVMAHVTNISAIKNATTIWEWNPALSSNCKHRSLNVISALQTLAIKVSEVFLYHCQWPVNGYCFYFYQIGSSGQWIEKFMHIQVESKIKPTLKIPLHSNI